MDVATLARRAFYAPIPNTVARTVLRPLKFVLPLAFQFPINGVFSVRVAGGASFRIACNPTSYLARVVFWNGAGAFEPHLNGVFPTLVRHARGFLDVGANIGYYSLMAAALNEHTTIWSFEPLPPVVRYLRRNKAINHVGRMRVVEMAASDITDATEFTASRNEKYPFVANHLTSTGSLSAEQATRTSIVNKYTVRCTTLDDFFGHSTSDESPASIDLIKIDVEANEHRVLDGATDLIATHRPVIICEVLRGRIEHEISSRIDALDYVARAPVNGRLTDVESLTAPDRPDDLVFVPRERMAEVESWFSS